MVSKIPVKRMVLMRYPFTLFAAQRVALLKKRCRFAFRPVEVIQCLIVTVTIIILTEYHRYDQQGKI